jgi:nucleoid DNA-binding protein
MLFGEFAAGERIEIRGFGVYVSTQKHMGAASFFKSEVDSA